MIDPDNIARRLIPYRFSPTLKFDLELADLRPGAITYLQPPPPSLCDRLARAIGSLAHRFWEFWRP